MSRRFSMGFCLSVLACLLAVVGLGVQPAWGQAGSVGSINVTVLDPDGKVVPGTTLVLQDLSTNDVRNAVTSGDGTYTFVNLSLGTYKLTVTKKDFQSQTFTRRVPGPTARLPTKSSGLAVSNFCPPIS